MQILYGLSKDDKYKTKIENEIEKKQKKIGDPIEYIYEFDMDKYLNEKYDVGIETKSEMNKRSQKIIDFIESKKCKKILVVSHAGIIMNTIKKNFQFEFYTNRKSLQWQELLDKLYSK